MSTNMTVVLVEGTLNGTALGYIANQTDDKFKYEIMTEYFDNQTVRTIILISYLITFLFGVAGNGLVLYIIAYFAKVRNKSVANYYILNLSVADFLFCCALPFFAFSTYTRHWPFGNVCCKVAYLLRDINRFTSIFTLCALSIDR